MDDGREIWEAFKRMREETQSLKAERRAEWATTAAAHSDKWVRKHETHWQYPLKGKTLQYWPGPRKWRWDGRTYTGNVVRFITDREIER